MWPSQGDYAGGPLPRGSAFLNDAGSGGGLVTALSGIDRPAPAPRAWLYTMLQGQGMGRRLRSAASACTRKHPGPTVSNNAWSGGWLAGHGPQPIFWRVELTQGCFGSRIGHQHCVGPRVGSCGDGITDKVSVAMPGAICQAAARWKAA